MLALPSPPTFHLALILTIGFVAACDTVDSKAPEKKCTGECLVTQALAGCEDFVEGFCGYIYRCYSGADLADIEQGMGWTGEASCITDTTADHCTEGKVSTPVREGRQRLDKDILAQCLTTMEQLACVAFADFALHPEVATACEEIPAGLRSTGQSCTESDDCTGLYGYCSDSVCESRGDIDYEIECDAPIGPGDCPGGTCLTFVPNHQDLTGVCTRRCTETSDCGFGGLCVDFDTGDTLCASTCLADEDCSGGLVCRISTGHIVGVCSVEPL